MASQKQLKALEKARAAKKRKSARRRGLMGLGLGSMDFSKTNTMDSLKSAGFIVLGYAGGAIGGKLIEKAVVKPGDEAGFKKFIAPLVQAGGGFLVSAAGGKQTVVKVLGQGMMASGVVSAIEAGMKKQITDLVGTKNTDDLSGLKGGEFERANREIQSDLMVDKILDENLNEIIPEDLDDDFEDFEEKRREDVRGIAEDIHKDIQQEEIAEDFEDEPEII